MKTVTEKEAYPLTKPMIYTLVSTLDKNGKPNAMGVSWVTKVSSNPPLWMIAVDPRRYSHEGIELHKEFVINFPTIEQAEDAMRCGKESGRDKNKFEMQTLNTMPSAVIKTPSIAGSLVCIECKVVNQLIAGDHTLFIGEVLASQIDETRTDHIYVDRDYSVFSLNHVGKQL